MANRLDDKTIAFATHPELRARNSHIRDTRLECLVRVWAVAADDALRAVVDAQFFHATMNWYQEHVVVSAMAGSAKGGDAFRTKFKARVG